MTDWGKITGIIFIMATFGCGNGHPRKGGSNPKTRDDRQPTGEVSQARSYEEKELACSGLQGTDATGVAKMLGEDGQTCVPLSDSYAVLQGTYRGNPNHASFDLKIVGRMFLMADEQVDDGDFIKVSLRLGYIEIKGSRTIFHFWKSSYGDAPPALDLMPAIFFEDPEHMAGKKTLVLADYAEYHEFNDRPRKEVLYNNYRP